MGEGEGETPPVLLKLRKELASHLVTDLESIITMTASLFAEIALTMLLCSISYRYAAVIAFIITLTCRIHSPTHEQAYSVHSTKAGIAGTNTQAYYRTFFQTNGVTKRG